MSEQVRKVGAVTILMWMVAAFVLPTVGYIASNALHMPQVIEQLENMTRTQKEIACELKSIQQTHIGLRKDNFTQHLNISNMIVEHTIIIKNVVKDVNKNTHDIEVCKSTYWKDYINE